MKVLWDGTGIAAEMDGMTNYSLNIIDHIVKLNPDNDYYVILKPGFQDYRILPKQVKVFKHRIPNIGLIREIKYLRVARKIANDFDVFHCLTGNWPRALNKGICTFHDLRYFSCPESYYGLSCLKSFYLKTAFKNAVKACDKMIAISNSTKADIIKYGNVVEDDITVIYHGIATNTQPEHLGENLSKLGICQPYILFVGELKRHKNFIGVIKAFNIFKTVYDKHNTQLVIVGKKHAGFLDEINTDTLYAIKFTGYVDNEYLALLYHNASLLALLSFVEGFGFPLLEAMYHNLPIICSDISSLSEVAGDAAIKVVPNDYDQVARAFAQVLNDEQLRKDLVRKGKQRLEAFKWETAAQSIYEIYRKYHSENLQ
jgi:glycosyltransferase involved in cell wall biosynthesis